MTAVLVATMIAFTVVANLLMKLGAQDIRSPLFLGLLSWRTFLGLGAFGCAGLVYAAILRKLPLNIAQSYAAAQFVAVIIASTIVLGEPILFTRWLGIVLIAAGILVVAASYEFG